MHDIGHRHHATSRPQPIASGAFHSPWLRVASKLRVTRCDTAEPESFVDSSLAPAYLRLPMSIANGIKGVTTMMTGHGAGARGIVYAWKQGTPFGHFFNAVVNQRGVVKFLDGQAGTEAKPSSYDVFYLLYTGKN